MEGETAIKAYEFLGLGGRLPMAGMSLVGGLVRMGVKGLAGGGGRGELSRFWDIYGPWAVRNGLVGVGSGSGKGKVDNWMCVYWEEWLDRDVDELRAHLGVEAPPDMREMRRRDRQKRKTT